MPSKKFHSGSPIGAIRDSRWLNFVNAGAEIAHGISYEGGDITVDPGRTSVLVRNSTGDALERFSIVGITDVLIDPSAKESEFLNHFALDADAPDVDRDGPGRIAVLQAPLAADKIGPALLWGMTPVKIDLPDSATYTAASIINDDATKLAADDDGDIPVVWHEAGPGEKWALVHLGVGGGSDDSTTIITDGCECNKTFLREGGTLFGAPTVCCKGHQRWTIDLGPVLGSFMLYHVSGDIWSTFNADDGLDNPYVVTCYPYGQDEYDLVMELTSAGATITLTPRDTLNCESVCFQYVRSDLFACQSANQFKLGYFDNARDLDLPLCLCVVPAAGETITCENKCDVTDTLPEVIEVEIAGVGLDCTPDGSGGGLCGCIPDGMGGTDPVTNCLHQSDGSCNPSATGCPDPGTPVSCSQINRTYQLTSSGGCSWNRPASIPDLTPGISMTLFSSIGGLTSGAPLLSVTNDLCGVCGCTTQMVGASSRIPFNNNNEPIDCSQPIVFDTWQPLNPGQNQCCDWSGATATVIMPGVAPPEGSGHCTSPCDPPTS